MTKIKKFKVEIVQSQTYVIDVRSTSEKEAKKLALRKFEHTENAGIKHYYEEGDEKIEVSAVYDVTNTDDPFNE